MNCEACRSLLSGFLDGALARDQSDQVARHLAACAGCREELAGLERVDRAIADLEAPAPPRGYLVELQARVRERVDERVAEREFEDAARASESSSAGGRARWWRFAPLAAAALVAIAVLRIAELSRPRVDLGPRDQVRSPEVRSPGVLPPDRTAIPPVDLPAPALHDAANAPSKEVNPSPAARGPSASAARPPQREMNSSANPAARTHAAKDEAVAASPSAAPETAPAQSMGTMETKKEETQETQLAPPSEAALAKGGSAAAMKAGDGSRRTAGVASEPPAIRGDLDGRAEQEAPEVDSPALGRAEHLIAVGNLSAGRKVLDSLMNGAPPVAIAARARFLRLAADEAEIESGSQADETRSLVRSLAARYAQLADELPTTAAGRDAAARAARLALEVAADTGDPGDCSFARARISAFANRYPQDTRADSLTAAGASLSCSR